MQRNTLFCKQEHLNMTNDVAFLNKKFHQMMSIKKKCIFAFVNYWHIVWRKKGCPINKSSSNYASLLKNNNYGQSN